MAKEPHLKSLLIHGKTTQWMIEWSKTSEVAVAELTGMNADERRKMTGRGGCTITCDRGAPSTINYNTRHAIGGPSPTEAAKSLLTQARRCKAWANHINIRARGKLDMQHLETFRILDTGAEKELRKALLQGDEDDGRLREAMDRHYDENRHRLCIILAARANRLEKQLVLMEAMRLKNKSADRKA